MILEEFIDTWNYTFVIIASIAIIIGAIITMHNIKKEKYVSRREKRSNYRNK